MILTVSELCDKAAKYLQSVSIGNKNSNYEPADSLKNGNVIKTYNFQVETPDVANYYPKNSKINLTEQEAEKLISIGTKKRTIKINIKTDENISEEYLNSISNNGIVQDWNNYVNEFVYSRINSKAYVGMSSLFLFLYLFRYFVDARFCQFSDIYTKAHVWLYKTGNVKYNPDNMVLADNSIIDKTLMDAYINTLVKEIVNRDTHKILGAAASTNSCSSSSSSSSCSSSSSSSSCSSSSSSSSSLFIAYFNLG